MKCEHRQSQKTMFVELTCKIAGPRTGTRKPGGEKFVKLRLKPSSSFQTLIKKIQQLVSYHRVSNLHNCIAELERVHEQSEFR
jgi:hypothetical protein